jgi:TP901 family phage tail tape measure protein
VASDLALDIWLRAHDEMSDVFKRVGKEAEGLRGKIGLLAGGVGVLAGGMLAGSVKMAADWQSATQAMANNTNMTKGQLEDMRRTSLALSSATGQSATSIAEGYMHIANHAYAGAAAFNIASAAARNAAATNGDVAEDANVLAGILREMNVSQKDLAANTGLATRFLDVMHNSVANSNWTMKQFAEGSKTAFAQAGLYHVPISQVAAQLAVLSEHGFPNASRASTNWTGMLRDLMFPTNVATKGMQALSRVTGVDLVGDIAKLRKDGAFLPQFLADINKATSDPAAINAYGSSAAALHAIMSQSQHRGVLEALTRNRPELEKVAAVTSAAQAGQHMAGMVGTNEAFAAQQKTLAAQMKDLHATVNAAPISLGTALLPAVTKLVHAVAPLIQQLSGWISGHQKLAAALLGGVAVLGTLGGAVMVMASAMRAAKEVTSAWTAAQWLLNAAMDANLIGIIVLAIAGLVTAGIYVATHWKQISAMLGQVWSDIADAAGDLWTWLTGIWNGIIGDAQLLWENLGEWLSGIWNGIASFAGAIWSHVVDFLKGLWDVVSGVWQGFWNGLGATIQTIWNGISGAAQTVWNTAVAVVTAVWDTISGAWTGAWDTIKTAAGIAWGKVSDAAKGAWDTAVSSVGAIWDTISGTWSTAWDTIKTDAQKAWTKVGDAANGAWDTAIDTVKKIWDTVSGAWTKAWDTVKTEVERKRSAITGGVGKAWNGAKNTITNLWNHVKGAWDKAWSNIGKVFSAVDFSKGTPNMWTDAKHTVETLWDKVKGLWTNAWNEIHKALTASWNGIKDLTQTTLNLAVGGVKKLWDGIGGEWTKKWNDIKNIFTGKNGFVGWFETNVIEKAMDWGKQILYNLIQGIRNAAPEFLRTWIDKALGPLARMTKPGSPPKEGPLAFWQDFSYYAEAVRRAVPQVQAASRDLASAAVIGGGGTFALGINREGLSGGAVAMSSSVAAGAGAGGVTIDIGGVHIEGGTFTDRKSIDDLAERVSESIMHKVRLQGGLLTQI